MVRPRKGTSPIGTLVDMTSAVNIKDVAVIFMIGQTGQGFDMRLSKKLLDLQIATKLSEIVLFMLDNESTSRQID